MAAATSSIVTKLYNVDQGLFMARESNLARPYKAGFYTFQIASTYRRSLTVKASSSSFKSVDKINGKKVNGIHVGDPAPLLLKKEDDNRPIHDCLLGKFVEDRFVYRQTFIIRSYEIGPDKTATMETLMNLLQVIV